MRDGLQQMLSAQLLPPRTSANGRTLKSEPNGMTIEMSRRFRARAASRCGDPARRPPARRDRALGAAGLVDMHCHSPGHKHDLPLELFLLNGVTTVRDPAAR